MDAGRVYFTVSVPGGNATVDVYMNSTKTTKVATGALVGNGGGTATFTPVGSHGLNGEITIAAGVVADSTGVAEIGSANGVKLHPDAVSGSIATSASVAGIMYSDGVADGSDVWVVTSGKAYILAPAGVPMGAFLLTSDITGASAKMCSYEMTRTAYYTDFGIGRALQRTAAPGLVLAHLDLRGFQRFLTA
jgi:hypothetical protein